MVVKPEVSVSCGMVSDGFGQATKNARWADLCQAANLKWVNFGIVHPLESAGCTVTGSNLEVRA